MNLLSHYQVIIIGAGPVGMLLALQLKQQNKSVLLIEARAPRTPVRDQRTLALSYASIEAFRAAGVPIADDAISKIRQVHVSRQKHFGRVLLNAEELALPYLGASMDYAGLLSACEAALSAAQVPVLWQTEAKQIHTSDYWAEVTCLVNGQPQSLTAQWLVLAEGGSLAEHLPDIQAYSHDYQQMAWVNTLQFEQENQGIAYERFTSDGPLALLPYGRDFRIVWTCSQAEAMQRNAMDLTLLSSQLTQIMGYRLGALRAMGQPAMFPLRLRQLNRVYSGRVLCIGNAAQTMHPVAAQGLNLGVRDAVKLAGIFAQADKRQLADAALARQYADQRYYDAHAVVGFTHVLVQWFDHAGLAMQWGHSAGMGLLGVIPSLRRQFTRHLVFGLPARQV